MTTPLNIVKNYNVISRHLSGVVEDGVRYWPCWHSCTTFEELVGKRLDGETVEKLRQLARDIIYPALQLHSLGIDYLWDCKKKEYIPFKKYQVHLLDNLSLVLECYKTPFSYRTMNHQRRTKTILKERVLKVNQAIKQFGFEASALLALKTVTEQE